MKCSLSAFLLSGILAFITPAVDGATAPHPLSIYVSEPIPVKIAFRISVTDLPKVRQLSLISDLIFKFALR